MIHKVFPYYTHYLCVMVKVLSTSPVEMGLPHPILVVP